MSIVSKLKQYIPYPSGVSFKKREVQITANNEKARSIISDLNKFSQEYRGLLGGVAALLFLIDWIFQFIPSWFRPLYWIIIVVLSVLVAIRIRVVARAEKATVKVTGKEATVTIDEDDSS